MNGRSSNIRIKYRAQPQQVNKNGCMLNAFSSKGTKSNLVNKVLGAGCSPLCVCEDQKSRQGGVGGGEETSNGHPARSDFQ